MPRPDLKDVVVVIDGAPKKPASRKEKDRPDWPFIRLLDDLLAPRGFRKNRTVWRKETVDTILALELENYFDVCQIRFGAWLKTPQSKVEARDVWPNVCQSHIMMDLCNLGPEPLTYRLHRAVHLGQDTVQSDLADLEDEDWTRAEKAAIRRALEPDQRLTMNWRVTALRESMEAYGLPILEKLETKEGQRKVLSDKTLILIAAEKVFRRFRLKPQKWMSAI